jgi:hypothetical protein
MIGFVVPIALALALLGLLLVLSHREKSEKRRLASEGYLPVEERVPRHYKMFTVIEKKLWSAEEYKRVHTWDSTNLSLRQTESKLVAEYLRGLREDFGRGNRIFGAVILHSPDVRILSQLERQRLRLRFSFWTWYVLISVKLRMNSVSVRELKRLTDVVATFAYQIRTMLIALEESGNSEFVRSVLSRS